MQTDDNWKNGRPMRPQMQIMRVVGRASYDESEETIRKNIRQAMRDMQPIVSLLSGQVI
jgi:hypothetical protein